MFLMVNSEKKVRRGNNKWLSLKWYFLVRMQMPVLWQKLWKQAVSRLEVFEEGQCNLHLSSV